MQLPFAAMLKISRPQIWLQILRYQVSCILGNKNPFAILTAALIVIPAYTSNLTTLPMISGLLVQGMNPAAVLTFLVAGPTTTLPAIAAVWGITNRHVFALYLSFSLIGALIFGYLYRIVAGF